MQKFNIRSRTIERIGHQAIERQLFLDAEKGWVQAPADATVFTDTSEGARVLGSWLLANPNSLIDVVTVDENQGE